MSIQSGVPHAEKQSLAEIVVVTLLLGEFICFLPAIGRRYQARLAIQAGLSNLAEQGRTNDEGYRF